MVVYLPLFILQHSGIVKICLNAWKEGMTGKPKHRREDKLALQ